MTRCLIKCTVLDRKVLATYMLPNDDASRRISFAWSQGRKKRGGGSNLALSRPAAQTKQSRTAHSRAKQKGGRHEPAPRLDPGRFGLDRKPDQITNIEVTNKSSRARLEAQRRSNRVQLTPHFNFPDVAQKRVDPNHSFTSTLLITLKEDSGRWPKGEEVDRVAGWV